MSDTFIDADGEKWDLVIQPKRKWLSLNLREIYHYRDLIYLMIKRDFTTVYKQTILGPLWFIGPAARDHGHVRFRVRKPRQDTDGRDSADAVLFFRHDALGIFQQLHHDRHGLRGGVLPENLLSPPRDAHFEGIQQHGKSDHPVRHHARHPGQLPSARDQGLPHLVGLRCAARHTLARSLRHRIRHDNLESHDEVPRSAPSARLRHQPVDVRHTDCISPVPGAGKIQVGILCQPRVGAIKY